MATITRVQHVQYDTVSLLAVQGPGTDKFVPSGQPDKYTENFGAVFSGNLRITRLASGNGYTFLIIDGKRGQDRKKVNFSGSALVRVGDDLITVHDYYLMLSMVEALRG